MGNITSLMFFFVEIRLKNAGIHFMFNAVWNFIILRGFIVLGFFKLSHVRLCQLLYSYLFALKKIRLNKEAYIASQICQSTLMIWFCFTVTHKFLNSSDQLKRGVFFFFTNEAKNTFYTFFMSFQVRRAEAGLFLRKHSLKPFNTFTHDDVRFIFLLLFL